MDAPIDVEKNIRDILQRNRRVEADKSWETSWVRTCIVAVITYIIAALILFTIGIRNFLASATIPTVGYLLSTAPLHAIKHWWIERYLHKP